MNWASCSTSGVESFTKLLASFWDSCTKQPVPVRLAGHQTPPPSTGINYWKSGYHYLQLPVYAAGSGIFGRSWGPHFAGGCVKKKICRLSKMADSMKHPRHFQLANDIHKRPWSSCWGPTNARESFFLLRVPPEKVSPNCIVYSEQIVYVIPVDWLATIYIYM